MQLPTPLTVSVSHNGGVTIDAPGRIIALSPYTDRAKRLTLDFGPGTHEIRTAQDVDDLPDGTVTELREAVA